MRLKLGKYFLLALLALFIVSCGGEPKIEILSPADGEILNLAEVEVEAKVPTDKEGVETSVFLNGMDISDSLSIVDGVVTGIISLVNEGVYKLEIKSADKKKSSSFIYSSTVFPDNIIPLYGQKNYEDKLQNDYPSTNHDEVISQIKELGYSEEVMVPLEALSDEGDALISHIYNVESPGQVAGYVVTADFGEEYSSFGVIFSSECDVEMLDGEEGEILDVCSETNVLSASPSSLLPSCCQNEFLNYMKALADLADCLYSVNPFCAISKGIALAQAKKAFENCLAKSECDPGDPDPDEPGDDDLVCWDDPNTPGEDDCSDGRSDDDPHMLTLDGLRYENQLIGEFIASRGTNNFDFELQSRQQQVFPKECVTGNTAVALKVEGFVVEYRVDDLLILDGEVVALPEDDQVDISETLVIKRESEDEILIRSDKLILRLKNKGFYLNYQLKAGEAARESLEGLLGNYDGLLYNEFTTRSGDVTWKEDDFIESWRISQEESLFTYDEGENTATYTAVQLCSVEVTEQHVNSATDFFVEQCGDSVEPNTAFIQSLALDMAAGMDSINLVDTVLDSCGEDSPLQTAVPLYEVGEKVVVDGKANIFGAGHDVPPGGGILPPVINLPPGDARVVSIINTYGEVRPSTVGIAENPDGLMASGTDINSNSGISGIRHQSKVAFLVGVFLSDVEPVNPAPEILDFSDNDNGLYFSPKLNQTFYIGDGLTGVGEGDLQKITVPNGATKLHLGLVDGYEFKGSPGFYNDNTGEYHAQVIMID